MVSLATGSLAVALCVIGVAVIGVLLLTGRIVWREGARVVIGCFILLGAPVIAGAFGGAIDNREVRLPPRSDVQADSRGDLPPADYDPYSGASLRRD